MQPCCTPTPTSFGLSGCLKHHIDDQFPRELLRHKHFLCFSEALQWENPRYKGLDGMAFDKLYQPGEDTVIDDRAAKEPLIL